MEVMFLICRASNSRDLISENGVGGRTERRTVCLAHLNRSVICTGDGTSASDATSAEALIVISSFKTPAILQNQPF